MRSCQCWPSQMPWLLSILWLAGSIGAVITGSLCVRFRSWPCREQLVLCPVKWIVLVATPQQLIALLLKPRPLTCWKQGRRHPITLQKVRSYVHCWSTIVNLTFAVCVLNLTTADKQQRRWWSRFQDILVQQWHQHIPFVSTLLFDLATFFLVKCSWWKWYLRMFSRNYDLEHERFRLFFHCCSWWQQHLCWLYWRMGISRYPFDKLEYFPSNPTQRLDVW